MAEKDLAKGAFSYEIYYLVTLYHLSMGVIQIKKEIIRNAAKVGALVDVGSTLTCLKSVDTGISNTSIVGIRRFSI